MANFTPAGVKAVVEGLGKFNSDLGKMNNSIHGVGSNTSGVSGIMSSFGGIITATATAAVSAAAAIGAAVIGIGAAGVKSAISFESAFAGVLKTTDGLEDEFGNLNETGKELRQGFRDLSQEIPISVEELAAIGEIGGQLGIGKDSLLEFSETIAAIGVSTNLTQEQAASDFAKMSSIFNIAASDMGDNISRIGSTTVALGNNFATTEMDISNFGLRLAGAGKIANLSQADVLGIGTALSSVGVEAEAGGTAVQKVLLAMNEAAVNSGKSFVDNSENIGKMNEKLVGLQADLVRAEAATGLTEQGMRDLAAGFASGEVSAEEWGRQLGDTNREQLFNIIQDLDATRSTLENLNATQGKSVDPKALRVFAETAGMTAEEFQAAFADGGDAAGAFEDFVKGLGAQGDNATATLDDLGLTDQRLTRAFLSLAGAGDKVSDTIDLANNAWEENDALQKEAAKRYKTTESQMKILKNTVNDVAISIGDALLPIVNDLGQQFKKFIENNREKLTSFFENLAVFLSEKLPIAIQFVSNLWTNTLQPAIATFTDFAVTTLIPAIMDIITMFQENVPSALETATSFFDTTLKPALETLQLAFANLVTFWEENGPAITEIVLSTFNKVSSIFREIAEKVIPVVADAFLKISQWFVENGPLIQSTAKIIGDAIVSLAEFSLGMWNVVQPILQGLIDIIFNLGVMIMQVINGDWTESWATALLILNTAWEAIKESFVIFADYVAGWFDSSWAEIEETWEGNWELFKEIVNLGWTAIEQFFTETIPKLIKQLDGFIDDIKEKFNIQRFISMGEAIIDGIKKGIKDAKHKVLELLKDLAKDALAAAKSALGIASPSKEFAKIGASMADGLIAGIDGMKNKVVLASGVMATNATMAAQGVAPNVNTTTNFNMNVNTVASAESVMQQFNVAKAMLG